MSSTQADLINNLVLLQRNAEEEEATKEALLRVCAQITSQIEVIDEGQNHLIVLDISDCITLYGSADNLQKQLSSRICQLGLKASMAASCNFHTARLIASSLHHHSYIEIPAGKEAVYLSRLPVSMLGLSDDQCAVLQCWGISTFTEFANIPLSELVCRFGQNIALAYELALGQRTHSFVPIRTLVNFTESYLLETIIDNTSTLLFILADLLNKIIRQAEAELSSILLVHLQLSLEDKSIYRRLIRPAIPCTDHKLLLKLIQLDLEKTPPELGVNAVTLSAEPSHSTALQLGLFSPKTPATTQLQVTLARLGKLVGYKNVGSVILENSHTPHKFALQAFDQTSSHNTSKTHNNSAIALRRCKMPIHVNVSSSGTPVSFRWQNSLYQTENIYGPWHSSGNWWDDTNWNHHQWDITATKTGTNACIFCSITNDLESGMWILEGLYD